MALDVSGHPEDLSHPEESGHEREKGRLKPSGVCPTVLRPLLDPFLDPRGTLMKHVKQLLEGFLTKAQLLLLHA